MALWGKSREIKALDRSILAARMALNMYDQLPADKQQNALKVAPQDIHEAARKASAAGRADAAREMLTAAKAKPLTSSIADKWPEFIDGALSGL